MAEERGDNFKQTTNLVIFISHSEGNLLIFKLLNNCMQNRQLYLCKYLTFIIFILLDKMLLQSSHPIIYIENYQQEFQNKTITEYTPVTTWSILNLLSSFCFAKILVLMIVLDYKLKIGVGVQK